MLLALKVKCAISEALVSPKWNCKNNDPTNGRVPVSQTNSPGPNSPLVQRMLLCEYGRDALCKVIIAQPNHSLNFCCTNLVIG